MTDTTPPPDRPLWQVMDNPSAGCYSEPSVSHHSWHRRVRAAELRALADAVVPEEPPGEFVDAQAMFRTVLRDERQRIRALLLAEAQRAEEGES